MGLDMYLTAKVNVDRNIKYLDDDEYNKKVSYIEVDVMYWRKANQIHKWFVDNVQDGNDDCGYHDLDKDLLDDLYSDCKKVLLDNSLADELLPTQEGFFFGSYEYDEYYYQDLKDTIEDIDKLKKSSIYDKIEYFVYHSSW
jgi:hypothetical protein